MKEPGNISNADWVKSSFTDATQKPPAGALTVYDIARETGFARSTVANMVVEKVRSGELIEFRILKDKHWTKYYLPAKKEKAKPAKRKR